MKFSCIITTRNNAGALVRTLDHLQKESLLPEHEREILVVDNGSSDGTAAAVSRRRGVRLISLAENEGVPARNLALSQARGKYVAFLGDDVRPVGRALADAVAHLARHPKTGAVVGRVMLPDGSSQAPALPSVLMGGASVARKSVLDEVGGFAAEFFRQAADYELSFRIWRAGYRIERFEDLRFQREAQPCPQSSEVACRMDLRNNLILCERYLPRPLRHAYRGDWMRRYALLALHDGHTAAASTAVKEARIWARRELAVGRKTLSAEAVESIFQARAQHDAVAAWAKALNLREVCIADWGKNMFATWRACVSAGLRVHAVLDNNPAFAGARYRNVPVRGDGQVKPGAFDGILISTVNPSQVDERAAELESKFRVPVLRLWQPAMITVPPPRTASGQPAGRKIDKAA